MGISRWFYQPVCNSEAWLVSCYPVLSYLFYDSVPIISIGILLVCLGIIIWTSLRRIKLRLRLQAVYFLLVFVLGSGGLINAVFKEHWGRPRPIQTETLGGTQSYAPPGLLVAGSEGHSFPSGHSSVGFAFTALWFLWRHKHPRRARLALWASLLFGTLVGLTRIASGGHFLSDVIWSAWMMLFTAWAVYYPLLNMPRRESHYPD